MNYLVNSGVFRLSVVFVLLGTLIMTLVKKIRKLFAKNKLKALIYALVIILSFALIGLLSSSAVLNNIPLFSFLGMEILFFAMGVLHLWVLRKFFPSLSEDRSDFFSEFFFSLIYVCFGLVSFLHVVDKFRAPFSYLFATSAILFLLPTLIYKMYELASLIPVPIFKTWKYPLGQDIKDPTADELAQPIIISFEFRKKINDAEITNFRVKAPKPMKLSKLFYFFILDYNERHPESKIEFVHAKNQIPFDWMFHLKPNMFRSIGPLDFDKTIATNKIKENAVIICKRVSES